MLRSLIHALALVAAPALAQVLPAQKPPPLGASGAPALPPVAQAPARCAAPLAAGLLALLLAGCGGAVTQPPGVLAPDPPLQREPDRDGALRVRDHSLTPLAEFRVQARVLSTRHYSDREAALAPVDLLLGWGRLSDSTVVDAMRFSQSGRWGYWRTPGPPPVPEQEILTSMSNMHIIPAEDWIESSLSDLRPGQVVTLEGQLVEAQGDDGFQWRSSLRRDDTGHGACELMLVRSLIVAP